MYAFFLVLFLVPFFIGIASAGPTVADHWEKYIKTYAHGMIDPDLSPGNPLFDTLSQKSFVLLGESTHGTLEYYTWRSNISKALIQHAGFNFIAVEGDWNAINLLDRYVRHLPPHPNNAHDVLINFKRWPQWMWANPVINDLAEWLHDYNRNVPLHKRVGIHGVDVYGWGDSLKELPQLLEVLAPGWGDQTKNQMSVMLALDGNNNAFYRAVLSGQLKENNILDDIYKRLIAKKNQFVEIDIDTYWQARQKTGLIRQAKQHLLKNISRHPLSWNPRAENFIHTLERLSLYYGENARGILWAHNTHIGDARYTPMHNDGLVTVGQQARERFGTDAVYLLGFASEQGTFRAGRQWGSPSEIMPLLPSAPISINHWLNRAAPEDAFWLPLIHARANPRLKLQAGHRAIGVTFTPSQSDIANYVPSNIPYRYDGILFIRNTQALPSLHP
jgi:erythromycin esterase